MICEPKHLRSKHLLVKINVIWTKFLFSNLGPAPLFIIEKFLNALFNTQAFMRFTDDLVFTAVTDSSRKKNLEFFKQ